MKVLGFRVSKGFRGLPFRALPFICNPKPKSPGVRQVFETLSPRQARNGVKCLGGLRSRIQGMGLRV